MIYHYEQYFKPVEPGCVFLNTNYVSTTNFDNHYNEFKYNSFIFGNSRSFFYRISDWKKQIGNEPAYHFESAGEALYTIHKKIQYLDKKGVSLKNALLVLDYDILVQDKPQTGHLGFSPPQLEEYHNIIDFHLASLKGFFNPAFIYAFFDFRISGKIKPYMIRSKLIDHRPFTYNYKTNEIHFFHYEKLIEENKYYTKNRMSEFDRDPAESYYTPAITQTQQEMLNEIRDIFNKHSTNYIILISPLYNQVRIANEDIKSLNTLFGEKYVFDFSGKNNITNDYHNYYEKSHYRPHVARHLMNKIYREIGRLHAQNN